MTDDEILNDFKAAVGHLTKLPCTREVKAEMARLGKPFLKQLHANGHTLQGCADLMYPILGLKTRILTNSGKWDSVRQF